MPALWSGHVVFGLVSVPVQLFSAAEESRPVLHQVHAADGSRIRHRRICEAEDREVPQWEIARGYETPDRRMVVLDDEDLEMLPLATKQQIDVLGFVDEADIDPLLYAQPYYAGPNGRSADRPYALLVEALARSGRVGVCKLALRSRERLAVLRPRRGVLVIHTLRWPQEIRESGDLASPAPVTDRELALAELLVEQLAGVDLTELRDEYGAALEQLVEAKLSGGELVEPTAPGEVGELISALEESLRGGGRR
jgi:DNA end-binding protein Ku